MPRPRKRRRVGRRPIAVFYKPQGIPLYELKGSILPVEGLEALRLADDQGLEHQQAADMMGISRPTFSRVLTEARRTVARALANGWAIRIEGGDYEFVRSGNGRFAGRKGRRHGGSSER